MKLLKIQLHEGMIVECMVIISGGPPWTLQFSGINIGSQEFVCEDVFDALCALRVKLEEIGAQALCAGARPEVFPSGMSRSMGGGIKAYITQIGTPATELVDIFDYAEPGTVGSVAQQSAFHNRWCKSILQRKPNS